MFVANSCLSGLPFFRGFFSKDMVITVVQNGLLMTIMYLLCFVGGVATGIYCMRIRWLILFSCNKSNLMSVKSVEHPYLFVPYFSLGFGSIFVGHVIYSKILIFMRFRSSSNEGVYLIAISSLLSLLYFIKFSRFPSLKPIAPLSERM